MIATAKSIRSFLGAKHFDTSRSFYKAMGFEESPISGNLTYFKVSDSLGFYLQDAYVPDWVDNTMIFLEVEHVSKYWDEIQQLGLPQKFENVRLSSIKDFEWGREFYLHDPSGILWHFGEFKNQTGIK